MLLRVPGLGVRAVDKIIKARRHTRLRLADLRRLSGGLKRSLPFLIAVDHQPGATTDRVDLRQQMLRPAEQLNLF